MAERRSIGVVPTLFATVVALLGVLAAVSIVLSDRHTADLEAYNRTRAAAANAVPVVAASLRSSLTDIEARGGSDAQHVAFADSASAGVPTDLAVQARDRG